MNRPSLRLWLSACVLSGCGTEATSGLDTDQVVESSGLDAAAALADDDGPIGEGDPVPEAGTGHGDGQDGGHGGDPEPVRFVVLGDGGTGDANQRKVAAAMVRVCAERGCDFALYLGDNIYDSGVSGPGDPQFQSKFEDPYAELDVPFYVALGNHDYGNKGINLLPDDAKSAAQVEYTAYSEKWNMPHYFYTFREKSVAFFALDTNAIVLDRFRPAQEQQDWLESQLAQSDAPWKIVFGHHPYISNGEHGNAGDYAGAGGFERFLQNGEPLQALVEDTVCGQAQVYFAGHDHDREWLEPQCGTTFIVSGAAAKLRALEDRGNAVRWADDEKRGFLWVEIDGDILTGVFYDEDGNVDYEDTLSR